MDPIKHKTNRSAQHRKSLNAILNQAFMLSCISFERLVLFVTFILILSWRLTDGYCILSLGEKVRSQR